MRFAAPGLNADRMRTVAWEDVGERVLRSWYRPQAQGLPLTGLGAERLPEVAARILEFDLARPLEPVGEWPEGGDVRQRGTYFLGVALADALARAGWTVEWVPGRPVRPTCGCRCIEPFMETEALVKEHTAPGEWRERCETWGITGLVLAEPPPS